MSLNSPPGKGGWGDSPGHSKLVEGKGDLALKVFPGLVSGGATPVPIPNTAVKPSSADGTARETVWESRSTPG